MKLTIITYTRKHVNLRILVILFGKFFLFFSLSFVYRLFVANFTYVSRGSSSWCLINVGIVSSDILRPIVRVVTDRSEISDH